MKGDKLAVREKGYPFQRARKRLTTVYASVLLPFEPTNPALYGTYTCYTIKNLIPKVSKMNESFIFERGYLYIATGSHSFSYLKMQRYRYNMNGWQFELTLFRFPHSKNERITREINSALRHLIFELIIDCSPYEDNTDEAQK